MLCRLGTKEESSESTWILRSKYDCNPCWRTAYSRIQVPTVVPSASPRNSYGGVVESIIGSKDYWCERKDRTSLVRLRRT